MEKSFRSCAFKRTQAELEHSWRRLRKMLQKVFVTICIAQFIHRVMAYIHSSPIWGTYGGFGGGSNFFGACFDWFANVNRFKKSDMLLLRYFCLKLGRDQNCFLAWTKCNESCWNFIQIAMHSHGGLSWRLEIYYMFKMCVHCISLAWPGWWHKGEICGQIYWSCILSQSAQTDRFN